MTQQVGFGQSLLDKLASMKLAIFVFLALAACSVVGTLLPQGLTEHQIHQHFSPGAAAWIKALGLNDVYRTGWFRSLLVLLCVNLTICSIQRLPKTLRLIRRKEEGVSAEKLSKFAVHAHFIVAKPLAEVEPRLREIVGSEFAPLQPLPAPAEGASAMSGFAEKGRWSTLMAYVVHLSVLVVLVGALVGSTMGFKGFMNISESEQSNEVMLGDGEESITLPFEVRNDDFDVTYYDTGAPKEFRSDLVIVRDGKEVLKQTIRVNDPLTVDGITFYQSSYGSTLKEAKVAFKDSETGKSTEVTLPFRQMVMLPGTKDRVMVMDFQQNLNQLGPALAVALSREGQEPTGSWILAKMSDFHGNKILNYQLKVLGIDQRQYTGLQVKRDPGVETVVFGFVAMVLAMTLAFYMSHRKIWVYAAPLAKDPRKTGVTMAGRANKNPLSFQHDFDRLRESVEKSLI